MCFFKLSPLIDLKQTLQVLFEISHHIASMKSQHEWVSCIVKEGIHELGYLFENVKMPMLYG